MRALAIGNGLVEFNLALGDEPGSDLGAGLAVGFSDLGDRLAAGQFGAKLGVGDAKEGREFGAKEVAAGAVAPAHVTVATVATGATSRGEEAELAAFDIGADLVRHLLGDLAIGDGFIEERKVGLLHRIAKRLFRDVEVAGESLDVVALCGEAIGLNRRWGGRRGSSAGLGEDDASADDADGCQWGSAKEPDAVPGCRSIHGG